MKSFKNFYIRNNNLVQLQNSSFESPLITTNSYMYYGDLSLAQKQNFKWTAGGNLLLPQGPILINNITTWGFSIPFPSGKSMFGFTIYFIYRTNYIYDSRSSYNFVLLSYKNRNRRIGKSNQYFKDRKSVV